jgi:nitrite reductase/ring-hydroxylating ferredoxin subunit
MIKSYSIFITSVMSICLFSACSKKLNSSDLILPTNDANLNLTVNLSDKDNEALTYNGGFKIISVEKIHVLVSRKTETIYWASACDCNAAVHSSAKPVLNYILDKSILKDDVCGSEFDATSGAVIKAPAASALSIYKVVKENNLLKVTK